VARTQPDVSVIGENWLGISNWQLGFSVEGVVFEDAPSGVRSGRAAGCKVVGLLTTHSREQMEEAEPDILVKDLSKLVVAPPVIWSSDMSTNISIEIKDSGGLEISVINHVDDLWPP